VASLSQLAKLWTQQGHQPASDILNLWKQYAAKGKAEGQLKAGMALIDGSLAEQDSQRGMEYLTLAAQQKPEYSYRIGRFFEELYKQYPHDAYQKQQLAWYRQAAAQGNTDAMVKLARAYREGEGEIADINLALQLYTAAMQQGNQKAALELTKLEQKRTKYAAQQLKKEQKRRKSHSSKAFSYAEALKQAKSGNPAAMREVGIALMQGKDTKQDNTQGLDWLNKAAFAEDVPAMLQLAKHYAAGVDGNYDLSQAYGWYQKAAETGNAEAQYQLGLGYARGIGVEKNLTEARKWLQQASQNGLEGAEAVLQTLQSSP
jgi:TPR repeat protein